MYELYSQTISTVLGLNDDSIIHPRGTTMRQLRIQGNELLMVPRDADTPRALL